MTGGSQQLRKFRRAMRDGASVEFAAACAGMSVAEAQIHARRDADNPPPPEAFRLLDIPDAVAGASAAKESTMARRKQTDDDTDIESGEGAGIQGEYSPPDAARAIEIYDRQIKPKLTHIATLKGDLKDPWDTLKEQSRVPKKDFNYVQSLVDEEDDAKRDHRLLALSGLLAARKLYLPRDLVTMANGEDGAGIVPTGEREEDELVTLSDSDFEADEDELAAQAARPSTVKAQAAKEVAAEQAALH